MSNRDRVSAEARRQSTWPGAMVVLLVCFGGCSSRPERDSKAPAARRPDIKSILGVKPSVLRAKPSVRIAREPAGMQVEKVLDGKEAVRGYVQERYYQVLESGERAEARIIVVLDSRWHWKGFVTETGVAYRYDARGAAVPLPAAGFVESIKVMLEIEDTISFVAYRPDEEKKAEEAVKGGGLAPGPKEK